MILSGTPRRFRLVATPRRKPCQPRHKGRISFRSYAWPVFASCSDSSLAQTPQTASAGKDDTLQHVVRVCCLTCPVRKNPSRNRVPSVTRGAGMRHKLMKREIECKLRIGPVARAERDFVLNAPGRSSAARNAGGGFTCRERLRQLLGFRG